MKLIKTIHSEINNQQTQYRMKIKSKILLDKKLNSKCIKIKSKDHQKIGNFSDFQGSQIWTQEGRFLDWRRSGRPNSKIFEKSKISHYDRSESIICHD